MAGEAKRICLWSFWVANLLVDAVYVIMSWATADNLAKVSGNLHIASWKDVQQSGRSFISNNIWRAPIAACALGGLMVVLFNLISCIVLIRKSMMKSGPGFGYGFIVAWAFVMSFFTLLCGLIIEGFKDVVVTQLEQQDGWTTVMSGAFKATYGFAYVVCVMFILFFLTLLIFQGAVTRELGIYERMNQHKRLLEMNSLAAGGAPLHPVAAPMQSAPI
eukprot:jgi/Chrzof1/13624/Cz08g04170.t1